MADAITIERLADELAFSLRNMIDDHERPQRGQTQPNFEKVINCSCRLSKNHFSLFNQKNTRFLHLMLGTTKIPLEVGNGIACLKAGKVKIEIRLAPEPDGKL